MKGEKMEEVKNKGKEEAKIEKQRKKKKKQGSRRPKKQNLEKVLVLLPYLSHWLSPEL